MTATRPLHLASLVCPPGEPAAAPHDLATLTAHARRVEDAGFTALVVDDDVSVRAGRPAAGGSVEPLTLLAALAMRTARIGLVATVTTELNEPFHVARRLASLDHLSGGRAGWNLDTDTVPQEPGGFVRGGPGTPADRHERAAEFLAVVRGLWDSYADGAIVADKRAGLYVRPGGRRRLDHVGRHFQVAGPLNVSRPPQGHPVVLHAATTPDEIALAARHADVVLTHAGSIDEARAVRAQLDGARTLGRPPLAVPVWAVLRPVVVGTEDEARRRGVQLRDHSENGAGDDGAGGERFAVGTPEQLADRITRWHRAGATDGFAVRTAGLLGGPDPFLDEVLPLLRRRGVLVDPQGATLRAVLGLPRPERSAS